MHRMWRGATEAVLIRRHSRHSGSVLVASGSRLRVFAYHASELSLPWKVLTPSGPVIAGGTMAQRMMPRGHGWWRAGVLVSAAVALVGCGSSGRPVAPIRPAPASGVPDTLPDTPTPTPDPTPTTPTAVIYGCDGQPVTQPDAFLLFCGDAGQTLKG